MIWKSYITINSTGFFGFQPWPSATATEVVKPTAKAPTSNDLITLIVFLQYTKRCVVMIAGGRLYTRVKAELRTLKIKTLTRQTTVTIFVVVSKYDPLSENMVCHTPHKATIFSQFYWATYINQNKAALSIASQQVNPLSKPWTAADTPSPRS